MLSQSLLTKLFCCIGMIGTIAGSANSHAQCTDWYPAAVNIQSAYCPSDGGFDIKLTGADKYNLQNIRYSATGPEVLPARAEATFARLRRGSYKVTVKATCKATEVKKTIDVTVGGPGYSAPEIRLDVCEQVKGQQGRKIDVWLKNGRSPYEVSVLSSPGSYCGSRKLEQLVSPLQQLCDITPGEYLFYVADYCGQVAATANMFITEDSVVEKGEPFPSLNKGTHFYMNLTDKEQSCNGLVVRPSGVVRLNGKWIAQQDISIVMTKAPAGVRIPKNRKFETPSCLLAVPGTYTFTMRVKDGKGRTYSIDDTLSYAASPALNLTAGIVQKVKGNMPGFYVPALALNGIAPYTYSFSEEGKNKEMTCLMQITSTGMVTFTSPQLTSGVVYEVKVVDACGQTVKKTMQTGEIVTATPPSKNVL